MDASGNRFDVFGNRIDSSGNRFDVFGNRIDSSGNRFDVFGNHMDEAINPHPILQNNRNRLQGPPDPNLVGWDPDRFRVPVSNFLCAICLNVFRNASTLECGHTFCINCIHQSRQERCSLCRAPFHDIVPDYSKRMEIMGLQVSCKHDGCTITESLRTIAHHEQCCAYQLMPCKDCKTEYQRQDMETHLKECPNRRVKCEVCHKSYPLSRFDDHTCPEAIVTCTMCDWEGKQLAQAQHNMECVNRVIACPLACYGCVYTGARSSMMTHLEQPTHLLLLSKSIEARFSRLGVGL